MNRHMTHSFSRSTRRPTPEACSEAIVGKRIPLHYPRRVAALDQHVGSADGKGLAINLLPIADQRPLRVQFVEIGFGDREHPARAARWIIDLNDLARLFQLGEVL